MYVRCISRSTGSWRLISCPWLWRSWVPNCDRHTGQETLPFVRSTCACSFDLQTSAGDSVDPHVICMWLIYRSLWSEIQNRQIDRSRGSLRRGGNPIRSGRRTVCSIENLEKFVREAMGESAYPISASIARRVRVPCAAVAKQGRPPKTPC
jgi:hypothetical protein